MGYQRHHGSQQMIIAVRIFLLVVVLVMLVGLSAIGAVAIFGDIRRPWHRRQTIARRLLRGPYKPNRRRPEGIQLAGDDLDRLRGIAQRQLEQERERRRAEREERHGVGATVGDVDGGFW